ncbi:hypothetical protein [Silvibacterium dinghuense]|uniref:Uncharacterized protein n=1 Tax=Silvibacterium dinghuense TaxID=1560006 RepID=A0A4Q1SH47_9BACT|nr:hypothetical protein [Silvibacterium dinghuense]RXS96653.1 hypothetical protein ESZ00_01525 [Silvibacterium dinghuense]GGG92566.1 hypothetical protein GCM10011586_04110 [Silvibacterium dinghuense]
MTIDKDAEIQGENKAVEPDISTASVAAPPIQGAATQEKRTGRRIGRTLLFFAGSALFGGLAVALWERKTLAEIRKREAEDIEVELDR